MKTALLLLALAAAAAPLVWAGCPFGFSGGSGDGMEDAKGGLQPAGRRLQQVCEAALCEPQRTGSLHAALRQHAPERSWAPRFRAPSFRGGTLPPPPPRRPLRSLSMAGLRP